MKRPAIFVVLLWLPSLSEAQSPTFFGSTFEASRLEALPLGRTPWAVFETVDPLAIVDVVDGGGLTTGRAGLIGVNGTSWTQTSYVRNGIDVTRPDGAGGPFVYPDVLAVGRLSLASALLPVELRGPGGVVLMDSAAPPAHWSGRAAFALSPGAATYDRGPAPAIDRLKGLTEIAAQTAGPALANRLQLSAAATRTTMEHVERGGATRAADVTSARLESIARTGSHHELATALSFSDTRRDTGPEVDAFRDSTAYEATGQFRSRRAEGGSWSLGATFQRASLDATGADAAPLALDPIRDGPLVDRSPAAARRLSSWAFEASRRGMPRPRGDAVHTWRAGATISRSTLDSTWWPSPTRIAEVIGDRPARVWTYTARASNSAWHKTELAAYVANRAVFRALDVDAGARVDTTSAGGINWALVSPRVAARWRLGDAIDIRGGYARYAHRLALTSLAFGDPAAPSAEVRRRDGTLIARLGPGGDRSGIDPDLASPWTDEIVAGVEWRPADSVRLALTGLRRRDRDLIASVNAGLASSDFRQRVVPDRGGDLLDPSDDRLLPVFDRRPESFGRDREILTNPDDSRSFFEALDVRLERRATRWWMLVGASASRTVGAAAGQGFGPRSNDQAVLGERLLTPNAVTFQDGRLFFDRAFTIKVAGTARLPLGVSLGVVARYQDGQPFARLVLVDDLAQGPEVIRAVPNGRHRFQYLTTLDLRVGRSVTVGGGRLTIALDGFNLLNESNEVEEHVIGDARFRAVTAVQPPRSIRVGLQIAF